MNNKQDYLREIDKFSNKINVTKDLRGKKYLIEKCIELNKKLIDSLPIGDLEIAACEGRIKELNKMKKDVEKRIEERNQPMITAVLSNGLVVRVPMKGYKETLVKMEKNIKEANKNKIGS